MGRLQDKTAVVTGAASGIGRAAARAFAAEGARVLLVDREAEALAAVAAEIGGAAEAFPADAGDEGVVAAFDRAEQAFGPLGIVFANAGVGGGLTPLLEGTVELWTEVLRINLIGPFLAIKHAAPRMAERGGGAIVLTASVVALRANASGTPYAASKAGVVSLAQTSATSLGGTGVRVNAICPGLIETGMTRPLFERARARGAESKIGQLNPTGRAGRPEEIAAMAVFLASDESSYVNGQAFAVDGGLSSGHPFTTPWR